VLLCEGEKAADAAQRMFPDHVGMSWMGGTSADEHADLAPLAGRSVVLWGDADAPGREAVGRLAARLSNARIVNTDGLPKGFDAADLEISGEDDPCAWLRARMVLASDADNSRQDKAFAPIPWMYRDPTKIPPREWLLGTTLLRGYASVLGSMGGVGKTAYAIALAFAFITGRRDILEQHVFQTGKVWLLTLEDNREELERRIAAAMIAHGVAADKVEGRLFINTASERPLLLARADTNGTFIVCEDVERLVDGIRAQKIGLTIIDPLVKSHAVVENSNEHMDRLIGMANDIARATHSAVLIAAHFRKGSGEDGARDAIRGGSALIDGARVADDEETRSRVIGRGQRTGNHAYIIGAIRRARSQVTKHSQRCVFDAYSFVLTFQGLCRMILSEGDQRECLRSRHAQTPKRGVTNGCRRDRNKLCHTVRRSIGQRGGSLRRSS